MAKVVRIKKENREPSWFKAYHEDQKRYMGALKEHFADSVKAIGEQYFDLKKDTTELKSGMLEVREDITELKNGMTEVKNTQKSHTEMIGQILIQLEEVKGELKQKVSYQDFTKLENRVAHLEAHKFQWQDNP